MLTLKLNPNPNTDHGHNQNHGPKNNISITEKCRHKSQLWFKLLSINYLTVLN